jgi:hypothetical protein
VLKSYRADTKLLTAARPPDFQDGRLETRKYVEIAKMKETPIVLPIGILTSNFSEIAPTVFTVVDQMHKRTDECKTVYPHNFGGIKII